MILTDQLYYNGGGIHFDGVAPRLTCLNNNGNSNNNNFAVQKHFTVIVGAGDSSSAR